MSSVYVEKFISNIVKNANVTSVIITNDTRNNRNTVAFKKCDLVLSQNRLLFSYSSQAPYPIPPHKYLDDV